MYELKEVEFFCSPEFNLFSKELQIFWHEWVYYFCPHVEYFMHPSDMRNTWHNRLSLKLFGINPWE